MKRCILILLLFILMVPGCTKAEKNDEYEIGFEISDTYTELYLTPDSSLSFGGVTITQKPEEIEAVNYIVIDKKEYRVKIEENSRERLLLRLTRRKNDR